MAGRHRHAVGQRAHRMLVEPHRDRGGAGADAAEILGDRRATDRLCPADAAPEARILGVESGGGRAVIGGVGGGPRGWHCGRVPRRFGGVRGDRRDGQQAQGEQVLTGHGYRLSSRVIVSMPLTLNGNIRRSINVRIMPSDMVRSQ